MSSQNPQSMDGNIESMTILDNLKNCDNDTLNMLICTMQGVILKKYGTHKSDQFAGDYSYILKQNKNNMQQTLIELINKYGDCTMIYGILEKIKRG